MSRVALQSMKAAGNALVVALDGGSPSAIDTAAADFRDAVQDMRASGVWHTTPGAADAMRDIAQRVDSLTARVRDLTRLSGERLAALESAGAVAPRSVYGRPVLVAR